MMNVDNFLKDFVNNETKEMLFGINTVMFSLAPNTIHAVMCSDGNFNLIQWGDNQGPPPSSEEIKDEYHRQNSWVEFYNYLKNEQPEVFDLLMRKLGYN